ncbi:hypothetical protein KOR42_06160 [Thalassoglobus neptunius]|uniref:Uncharacterized protein n=1 Tax=Thalassoglobus neptunius TaxID=1938619 RepID=A0A5C5X383_9PLAN|nr:hypothetical protein [Thalassoglobus neptunius]TWT57258.1 hypothetical protein KOR42_06160 [Thalassoglobus neptunius]
MKGVILSVEAADQIQKVVREQLRRERGLQPRQARWHKKGSGGGTCDELIRWILVGNPTSGSMSVSWTLPDGSDTILIPYNSTAGAVKTLIEAHDDWSGSYTATVTGGPFPINSISVRISGFNLNSYLPTASAGTLAGGARSGVRQEIASG